MKYFYSFFILTVIMGVSHQVSCQDSNVRSNDGVPQVFILGTYQESYAALSDAHQNSLMGVCDNDMDIAFQKWIHMMSAMEEYSELIDYDIKGLKIWIQVYWHADGTVNHIAYFLKPNSRNLEYEDLSAFFKGFVKKYQLPVSTSTAFSHYGSANFPLYARPISK